MVGFTGLLATSPTLTTTGWLPRYVGRNRGIDLGAGQDCFPIIDGQVEMRAKAPDLCEVYSRITNHRDGLAAAIKTRGVERLHIIDSGDIVG